MRRLPGYTLALTCGLALAGCNSGSGDDEIGDEATEGTDATGDGDGDTGDGDGDGDTGDGDGDTGDGDGDTGDGDGDTGDGDGDTGDGDGDTGDGDGDGDTGGEFTLTSPAYDEGGTIPDAHSCFGANISPELEWTGAPAEALSYAVFFTDVSIAFHHSAIWDIPAQLDGLPEDVDKEFMPADVPGASQTSSYAGTPGYAGPCPPEMHTYQFIVYALDVATLEEIDTSASLGAAQAAFEAHSLGTATLDGDFTPPP